MNKVIMTGRMCADPEARTTGSGKSVCNFRIAVQRQHANAQGVREADFFNVVAWGKTANFVNSYLSKGRMVAVEGSLQNRSYEAQDGSKRFVSEIIAFTVEALGGRDEGAQKPSDSTPGQYGDTGDLMDDFTPVDDPSLPFL